MNGVDFLEKVDVQTISIRFLVKSIIKRIFDILIGIVGIITLVPLFMIIKIVSIINHDYAPIIFKQKRIGKNGKYIYIYKFRSMIPNAEDELERLMKVNKKIRKEYLENKKLRNDPRITKVGKVIRKTSLDEFPQFLNVLKGDMSFVGPRPYLLREKDDIGYLYSEIVKVKPGITGPWQVSGRNNIGFSDRVKMEAKYASSWGLKKDIAIIFRTFSTVLKKEGAK